MKIIKQNITNTGNDSDSSRMTLTEAANKTQFSSLASQQFNFIISNNDDFAPFHLAFSVYF